MLQYLHMTSSPTPADPRSVIKTEDGVLAYYFTAQVANRIVRFTKRVLPWMTPNWFTTASFILACVCAALFAQGDYHSILWGLLALHLSFIFDCCDGQLARLTGLKLQAGAWFDYHSDKLKDGLILLALAWGVYAQTGAVWIFAAAFCGIFFLFLRKIAALNRDVFMLQTTGSKDAERTLIENNPRQSQFMRTLKHSTLFQIADRITLYTIFGLLNWMSAAIVIYAALNLFYATASSWLNYKTFAKSDRISSTFYTVILAVMTVLMVYVIKNFVW